MKTEIQPWIGQRIVLAFPAHRLLLLRVLSVFRRWRKSTCHIENAPGHLGIKQALLSVLFVIGTLIQPVHGQYWEKPELDMTLYFNAEDLKIEVYGINMTSKFTVQTTFSLYWANGPSLLNKMSTIYHSTEVPGMVPYKNYSKTLVTKPASSFTIPPGATHILAVIDEDNLVDEQFEINNLEVYSLWLDMSPSYDPNPSDLSIRFENESEIDNVGSWVHNQSAKVEFFWARGPTLADRTSETPIHTGLIESPFTGENQVLAPASLFQNPPDGARYILVLLDGDGKLLDRDRTNNLCVIPLWQDLSFDPWSPFPGSPPSCYLLDMNLHFSFVNHMLFKDWMPTGKTTAKVFWAAGPTLADRTSETPVFVHQIEAGVASGVPIEVVVDASLLRNPPSGSNGLLIVLDPDEALCDLEPLNNVQFLSMVAGDIDLISETDPNVQYGPESPDDGDGTPIKIKGKVYVTRSGVWRELKVGDLLLVGDEVSTAEKSFVKLTLKDSSVLILGPNSRFVIRDFSCDGQSVRSTLDLLKGKLRAKIIKRALDEAKDMDFKTKTAALGVRGTEFDLEYFELNGVGTTAITVYEGLVEVQVSATGEAGWMEAGEAYELSASVPPVPSIIGSWLCVDQGGGSSIVTFLANGEYLFFRDGDNTADPGGMNGMEHGTYRWYAEEGILAATVLADTNGEWGLSYGLATQPTLACNISETTMVLAIPFKGKFVFSRVGSQTSPLVGSWRLVGGELAGGLATVTFHENGTYHFIQDGDPDVDPTGTDGGERGTYSWDAGTGGLATVTLVDTCGSWGFSRLSTSPRLVFENNTIVLTDTNLSAPLTFYRVRPFDGSYEGWKALFGLFGSNAEANATPFGDGIPNVLRYALNLDSSFPSRGDLPVSETVEISGARFLVMEFRCRKNLDGVVLRPEFSTTLAGWVPVPAGNIERLADDDADTARYVVRMPFSGTTSFLRLAATVPAP